MDVQIGELFAQVERHVMPLIGGDSPSHFSNDECRVLALQGIMRLNQRIGLLARSGQAEMGEMKLLQTYVNNLTLGVKNNNVPQMRAALKSIRSFIQTLAKSEKND